MLYMFIAILKRYILFIIYVIDNYIKMCHAIKNL